MSMHGTKSANKRNLTSNMVLLIKSIPREDQEKLYYLVQGMVLAGKKNTTDFKSNKDLDFCQID